MQCSTLLMSVKRLKMSRVQTVPLKSSLPYHNILMSLKRPNNCLLTDPGITISLLWLGQRQLTSGHIGIH
uniref:Uncharacterized protein n=1 Tax=Arundo donax TaxID=35708 RepID=A0A0A8ZA20_ARUDO